MWCIETETHKDLIIHTQRDTHTQCISTKCFSEGVGTHSSLRLPTAHSNYHSALTTMGRDDDEWTIIEFRGCMHVCVSVPFIPGVL